MLAVVAERNFVGEEMFLAVRVDVSDELFGAFADDDLARADREDDILAADRDGTYRARRDLDAVFALRVARDCIVAVAVVVDENIRAFTAV